jgi:hypothetical protein
MGTVARDRIGNIADRRAIEVHHDNDFAATLWLTSTAGAAWDPAGATARLLVCRAATPTAAEIDQACTVDSSTMPGSTTTTGHIRMTLSRNQVNTLAALGSSLVYRVVVDQAGARITEQAGPFDITPPT